ncbi:MAG TPA: glutamate--tRNA ligase family protein [Vicinamibacterales bacterium]|nr:glutamate--tRNA ligase family protein [Vicinamibacterales bacterium]
MLRPDLVAAARSLTSPPVTRFAPSPTGYLHLGHIVNAIYTWGIARALGGRVLLRLEDHDRIRSRAAYEAAIIEDLDWLEFVPDDGRLPLMRQSDTPAIYRDAVDTLKRTTHVYACDCSRTDVGGERYVGRCRTRGLSYVPGHGVRVQFNPKTVHAHDLLAGPLAQVPSEQCGDLLLRDRDGNWTYQFAVTVDDVRHGVTLVIRGADLLASTGRQVLLAEMLGRPTPPVFLHHPLIMGRGGEKLSKSAGNTGVRELRAQGLGPEDVIGRAAAAIGLIASPRAIRASEVASLFLHPLDL